MRRCLFLLVFALAFCLTSGAEARKLALLVGVDEYDNVPSLKCCVNDMKALKEALINIGFQESDIIILTTGSAIRDIPTKAKIEQKVADILDAAQPDDLVFFAFSGHGAREGNTDYFCPPFADPNNIKGTCVSITKVMKDLSNCEASFKWMVVDACRNDPNNSRDAKAFQVIPSPPHGVALFQSCDKGEKSYEEKQSGGHGYFTKNLVAALSGEADTNRDGKLTLFEVCSWTADQTQAEVEKEENKTQRPFLNLSVSNFTLSEDINVPKARKLIEEARKAVEEENYELALKKYDEAIALCPRMSSIKRERKTAQRLYDFASNNGNNNKPKQQDEDARPNLSNPGGNGNEGNPIIVSGNDNNLDLAKEIPEIQEGLKLLQNNDVDGALEKFEEARKSHPEFSPAELMLAKLALQINPENNGPAARLLIERCVKNKPNDPEAFIFLGDYNLGNNSVTEADLLFRQAGVLLKNFQGNAQRRSAMIRQFNAGMGMVQERRGKYEQAKAYLESYLKSDPGNDNAKQMLARINSKIQTGGDPMDDLTEYLDNAVIESLQTAANSDQASQNVPEINEGLRALRNRDVEGALRKFEAARRYHPEFSPAELMLAKLVLQVGPQTNGRFARMLIERCAKNNPEDPEAFIFLGDYNLGNGSITEAELLFRQAGLLLKNFQGNSQRRSAMIRQFNAGMANVLERRGKFDEAKDYMESYLKHDQKNVTAMQQLARIYLNMDKTNDAIAILTKAKAIDRNILTPEAIVAMFYQQKGNINMASTYMTKALNKAPRDLNTRLAAAQWSQMINKIDQAIIQADAALQIDPRSEAAMLLRGNFALMKKDYFKAIEMYNKILANSPDNFAAANNIALALCETGRSQDIRRAIEYAGVNAQRFNSQPEVYSTLGYVLYKNGEIDKSLQALQKSIQLSNGRMSPDTAYYLCAALVAKGAEEGVKQAKEILTKTLDSSPTFNMRPEAEALKARLDRMGW